LDKATPLLEFQALNRGIDEAAAIAQKLHDLLDQSRLPQAEA